MQTLPQQLRYSRGRTSVSCVLLAERAVQIDFTLNEHITVSFKVRYAEYTARRVFSELRSSCRVKYTLSIILFSLSIRRLCARLGEKPMTQGLRPHICVRRC